MLFSEPKIPQFRSLLICSTERKFCFSALQRAENSSIRVTGDDAWRRPRFQCSSASRKFLNPGAFGEVSSPQVAFQCSSASRKFLNKMIDAYTFKLVEFQCSSASRKFLNQWHAHVSGFWLLFQCSSASRKFLNQA